MNADYFSFQVLQLLSQAAGTSFNDFSNSVSPSLAQFFGFTYGNIVAFNAISPSYMLASPQDPICVYASESLALRALTSGRISVVVDPAKEPCYNAGVDGPAGERIALAAYVPIPDHRDSSTFIAVLVLAHLLPPSQAAAAEARQKYVSDETVEDLKVVSILLSAPLSRSVMLLESEMRLSECDTSAFMQLLCLHMLVFISLFGIVLISRYRYRAGAAFLTGCNAMSRVSFDSNTTLFATVEYFMSAFSCDLVKIVSVSDQNDVALHLTVSRGEDLFHLPSPTYPFSLEISGASPSRREVISIHSHALRVLNFFHPL